MAADPVPWSRLVSEIRLTPALELLGGDEGTTTVVTTTTVTTVTRPAP
jgi:hypothetical protein